MEGQENPMEEKKIPADTEENSAEDTASAQKESPVEEEKAQIPEECEKIPESDKASQSDAQLSAGESTYGENNRKKSPFADSPYEMHKSAAPACPEKTVKPKKHKNRTCIKNWAALIGICLAVAVVCSGVTALFMGISCRKQIKLMNRAVDEKIAAMKSEAKPETPSSAQIPQPDGGLTPGQIYEANAQTVVSVMSTVMETDEAGQDMVMESAGSGFIVSESGYIVTNCHVVEGAESVKVRDHDANEYEAEIVGKDAANDVALLKIEGENLHPVKIGSCEDLFVGDRVVAIGHPLGNQNAILTVGYVSAKNQVVYTDGSSLDMIQTDAAINSGNSGGPLFDSQGRVIGITTAKYSGYTSSGASIEGVGYAIPMDDVVSILEELKEFGQVKRAYLGVMVKNVDLHAQEFGLPAGAFVQEAMEGLAADKAGIREKDVIVEMGGYEVTSVADLTRVLRKFKAGEEVTAKVWRGGDYQYVSVMLEEMPTEDEPAVTEPAANSPEPAPVPQNPPQMPQDWFDFFNRFFGDFGQ